MGIRSLRIWMTGTKPTAHRASHHRYYTGDAKAPILTLVIGGNHEASNYFWEL